MNKKTKKCSVEISLTSLTSENLFKKKKSEKSFLINQVMLCRLSYPLQNTKAADYSTEKLL